MGERGDRVYGWLGFGSLAEYGAQMRQAHRLAVEHAFRPSHDYKLLGSGSSQLKRTLNGFHVAFLGLGECALHIRLGRGHRRSGLWATQRQHTWRPMHCAWAYLARPHPACLSEPAPPVAGMMLGGTVFITAGYAAANLAVRGAAGQAPGHAAKADHASAGAHCTRTNLVERQQVPSD
jgi:hypothetical protein